MAAERQREKNDILCDGSRILVHMREVNGEALQKTYLLPVIVLASPTDGVRKSKFEPATPYNMQMAMSGGMNA